MGKMKRLAQPAIIGLVAVLLLATPVLAADVSGANYIADIVAANTGSEGVTKSCTPVTINDAALVEGGYVTEDLLNTAIQLPGGTDVAYMPGVGTNPWVLFTGNIGPAQQKSMFFYAGGPAMQSGFCYFPASGGMTTTDSASMELGNNFAVEQKGYVDTASGSGKNLVYKAAAFITEIADDGTIVSGITGAGQAYTTGDNNEREIYGSDWEGQTFTVGASGFTVTGVKLKLWRDGNPGTFTVSIRATSGGLPTGSDLTSGSMDGNTITTTSPGEWYTVGVSSYSLDPSTEYAIVTRAVDGDIDNLVEWRTDTTPSYGGGTEVYSTDSGQSWDSSDADHMFEIMGTTIQVTATGVTSGEHTIKTQANGDFLQIWVDGELKEYKNLYGASVPDNDNDWVFLQNGAVPYMEYHKITVGGTLKQHIVYERNTTFTDQSGNNNDATPTFRTTPTVPDLEATFSNFRPISENEASVTAGEDIPPILKPEDVTMPSQMYTEMETEHLPGAKLLNELLGTGGVPLSLFWIPIVFAIAALGVLLAYGLVRSMLIITVLGLCIIVFFSLTGVIPFWTVFIYVVLGGGLCVAEKHLAW